MGEDARGRKGGKVADGGADKGRLADGWGGESMKRREAMAAFRKGQRDYSGGQEHGDVFQKSLWILCALFPDMGTKTCLHVLSSAHINIGKFAALIPAFSGPQLYESLLAKILHHCSIWLRRLSKQGEKLRCKLLLFRAIC